jgi:transcriptional regulator with XRE-family HTH domain
MNNSLNTSLVKKRLTEIGYSAATLSRVLSVSREAVSQWLKNESFPRPDKLLKMGQLLSLKYSDLVIQTDDLEPIIAFRKVGHAVTKDKHIKRAKEMGFALENLVPFLPFDTVTLPVSLNSPVAEYDYIQTAVKAVRSMLEITAIKVEFSEIINYFVQSKTILIPILLGQKENHENALHIRLPRSATNWIYINLDTNELDFKFWLVHELGHVFTPQLRDDEAEEFCDNFAGAFLFPAEIASPVYYSILAASNKKEQMDIIFSNAERYTIAAYTVYMEINKFAARNNQPKIDLGQSFFIKNTDFIKRFQPMSRKFFGDKLPSVADFISVSSREFRTIFFEVLKEYIAKNPVSPSFVRCLLNLPVIDSVEIFNYLKNAV